MRNKQTLRRFTAIVFSKAELTSRGVCNHDAHAFFCLFGVTGTCEQGSVIDERVQRGNHDQSHAIFGHDNVKKETETVLLTINEGTATNAGESFTRASLPRRSKVIKQWVDE